MPETHTHDILVIGSGAAGLTMALHAAHDADIAVIAKGALDDGSTRHAQGGVAAVMDKKDTIEAHVGDTLAAGAGLCREEAVRFIVEHSAEAIEWLIDLGVPFTPEQRGERTVYHLTREGGHSHRRVIHAADHTGRSIEETLLKHARQSPRIALFDHCIAVDLIHATAADGSRSCVGAYILNLESGKVETFRARSVVLATGGASKVYLYTSNPDGATGDGVAMAWRTGCRVVNMEFNQFHPTCLYHPEARTFLITEAIRGEGGRLLLPDGTRFMPKFDAQAELAPRDIVARAIDHEIKRLGIDCVFLDISHKPADFIRSHFPTVYGRCLELGIDITREPIPVVPAAHYTCGGVLTDLRGRTDATNLYAIGEISYTGLHGANRMASNSLLECLVMAKAAANDIVSRIDALPVPAMPRAWDESRVTDSDEEVVVAHNWDELRRFMWDYVGIVRTDKRLQRAKRRIDLLLHEIAEYYGHFRVNSDLLELRNLAVVADLIIRSAQQRRESRGLHFTLDHPVADTSRPPHETVLVPDGAPERPFSELSD